MSNYTQVTSFTPKDALVTGNPLKLIKGADLDAELGAISTAIATKYDASNVNSAPVLFNDGAVGTPGISFSADTNTGIYRIGADNIGIATGGTLRLSANASGQIVVNTPANNTTALVLNGPGGGGGNYVIQTVQSAGTDTGLLITAPAAGQALIRFDAAAATKTGYIGVVGTAAQVTVGSAAGDMTLATTAGAIRFAASGSTDHLVISSTPSIQFRGPNAAALVDMTPDKGSFTGTLTGMTAGTTGTVNWVRMGNLVCLYVISAITGTSNTTAMTMTGLPAAVTPAQTQQPFCASLEDNTVLNKWGCAAVANTGVITFSLSSGAAYSSAGFTAAGTKGLTGAWSITYPIA